MFLSVGMANFIQELSPSVFNIASRDVIFISITRRDVIFIAFLQLQHVSFHLQMAIGLVN